MPREPVGGEAVVDAVVVSIVVSMVDSPGLGLGLAPLEIENRFNQGSRGGSVKGSKVA